MLQGSLQGTRGLLIRMDFSSSASAPVRTAQLLSALLPVPRCKICLKKVIAVKKKVCKVY